MSCYSDPILQLECTFHHFNTVKRCQVFQVNSTHCILCVCVYSNSRNDVPRVAQRYGTFAAHTRHRASVLVVFVVFCVHMYSFASCHRRHSVTLQSPVATLMPLFSSSELTGCGYPGLLDWKNRSVISPRWESNPPLPACKASTLSTRPGASILVDSFIVICWASPFVISGASGLFCRFCSIFDGKSCQQMM